MYLTIEVIGISFNDYIYIKEYINLPKRFVDINKFIQRKKKGDKYYTIKIN